MKTQRQLSRFLLLCLMLVGCIFLVTSCDGEPTNFVVTGDTVCRCGETGIDNPCNGHLERWQHTFDNLLEVSARDFTGGEFIGRECQGEALAASEWPPFWFNSWRPVDGFKHNMSATLHHFNWNYGDDDDWNLHVVPTMPFSFLIDDVEAMHSESEDDHDKCDGPQCMEAEISPDKEFWANPWFFLPGTNPGDVDDNGFSNLEGRQMGFYGPWIMDANHDFKSEIHPAEMIWFKDHFRRGVSGSGPPLDIFWLLFMQDNTGRFDDRDNFDCDGSAPPGWRPWTDSPRSGQFNIAFEVDPSTEVANFYIVELFKRFVVTKSDPNARRDADDGVTHALQYNGRIVVNVEETQPNDDDLGVTFTNLCLGRDGKLRGFVSIRSKIGGNDDKDEEGFHILYVARSKTTGRPDLPGSVVGELPKVLATAKQLEKSLSGRNTQFTGDLQVTLTGNKTTSDADFTVAKIEFAGKNIAQELKFQQNKQTREVVIEDVPLVNGRLTITTASGIKLISRAPALSPFPVIQESVTRSAIDAEAGKFLPLIVNGVRGGTLPGNRKLSAFQELQLRLTPRYAAGRGDEIVGDTPSSFANELNQAIAENRSAKLQELFNSAQPFTIAWTFEAVNLATGKPVPVYTDNQTAAESVQVQVTSGQVANDTLQIRFASSAGIVELRAKANVTDTAGRSTVVERRVWSHGFQSTGNNAPEWLRLIHALSGVRETSVLVTRPRRKEPPFDLVPDSKTRRAHILSSYVSEIIRDRQITIEELRRGVRTTMKFSEK